MEISNQIPLSQDPAGIFPLSWDETFYRNRKREIYFRKSIVSSSKMPVGMVLKMQFLKGLKFLGIFSTGDELLRPNCSNGMEANLVPRATCNTC